MNAVRPTVILLLAIVLLITLTMDPALIFRVDLDREHCMKDICQFCEFFLTNAPVLESETAK